MDLSVKVKKNRRSVANTIDLLEDIGKKCVLSRNCFTMFSYNVNIEVLFL